MAQAQVFQRAAGRAAEDLRRRDAVARRGLFHQRLGQHQPERVPAAIRAAHQRVGKFRAKRYRERSRQRPGRGGPDRHRDDGVIASGHAKGRRERIRIDGIVGHIHRAGGLVCVLDLCLGQGRTAVEAPVHRLHAACEVAVADDLRQRAQFAGLETAVEGLVRMIPVADHAQALEVGALQVDLRQRVLAAFLAEGGRIELDPDLAVLLLHRQLDRQAVAVPARHIGRIHAVERSRLDDDVLEDLVDRVAQVDRAVGVGRSVVQHETRSAGTLRAQPRVDVDFVPASQRRRFALGQVAAHREVGGGEMDGGFVVAAHGRVCSECGFWEKENHRHAPHGGGTARPGVRAIDGIGTHRAGSQPKALDRLSRDGRRRMTDWITTSDDTEAGRHIRIAG